MFLAQQGPLEQDIDKVQDILSKWKENYSKDIFGPAKVGHWVHVSRTLGSYVKFSLIYWFQNYQIH